MTNKEINMAFRNTPPEKWSKDEYSKVGPFAKRACHDCRHLYAALNLWCINEKAKEYRGTGIPGVVKCKFWKPAWAGISPHYYKRANHLYKLFMHRFYDPAEPLPNFLFRVYRFFKNMPVYKRYRIDTFI